MKFSPAVALLVMGCTTAQAEELGPSVGSLRKLPGVANVELRHDVESPDRRVIHILNWHWIPKDIFSVDVRDSAETPLSDAELKKLYADFLKGVEKVQAEQTQLLRTLIQQYGVKQVFYEGLTDENLPSVLKLIDALKEFEKHKPDGDTAFEQFLLEEYRTDMLRIGAAGRLMISGELKSLSPADDSRLLDAANPVQGDRIRFDKEANERREDATIRHLKRGGRLIVLIMGGDHDLADNMPEDWEYVRVTTEQYLKQTSE